MYEKRRCRRKTYLDRDVFLNLQVQKVVIGRGLGRKAIENLASALAKSFYGSRLPSSLSCRNGPKMWR